MGWQNETLHFDGEETAIKMKTEYGIAKKIETKIKLDIDDVFEMSGKQYKVLAKQPRRFGCTYFIEEINSSEGKDAE